MSMMMSMFLEHPAPHLNEGLMYLIMLGLMALVLILAKRSGKR